MRYKTRPGVVLTEICGEAYLVTAAALREECPYVTQINETTVFLWQNLTNGADLESLEAAVAEEYEIEDPKAARAAIADALEALLEKHLLVRQETEDQKNGG